MKPAMAGQQLADPAAYPLWAFLAGAMLIPSLYLLNLSTPFDFSDDGALVYSVGGTDLIDWFGRVWHNLVVADFQTRGPFRPTFWFFQQVAAVVLGPVAPAWRLLYFVWSIIGAASMLLLMRELRIGLYAALCVTALAMWNFQRGEIWTHFGLTENLAMPFACLALVCACRAGRSSRPLGWDVCGFLCILAALGTKNTFMAIVPAQLLLRIAPDGTEIVAGLRKRWLAAVCLASSLLLPFGHLLLFFGEARPTAYAVGMPTPQALSRVLSGYMRAMNLLFLAPALVLVVSALARSKRQAGRSPSIAAATWAALSDVYRAHRAAFLAGALLVMGGASVYLPVNVGGGRYTLPGVLGLDFALAALLTLFFRLQPSRLKAAAVALLTIGLICVAGGGWMKADRMAAEQKVLTDVLDHVERNARLGTSVVWYLPPSDGAHFLWHLQGRGRRDITLIVVEEDFAQRTAAPVSPQPLAFAIGTDPAPPAGAWTAPIVFERDTWLKRDRYRILVWPARPSG